MVSRPTRLALVVLLAIATPQPSLAQSWDDKDVGVYSAEGRRASQLGARLAVVVGVDDYTKGLRRLNFAEKDAGPGQSVTIGAPPSQATLNVMGKKGPESFVAYLVEWNPFLGFDWSSIADTNHVFQSTDAAAAAASAGTDSENLTRTVQFQSRDIGVGPSSRPGEGWAKAVLRVTTR